MPRLGDIQTAPPAETLEARFWAKVDRQDPAACWEWTASLTPNGYGQMAWRADGKKVRVYAHRFSVELDGREIPDGEQVDHLCRNRRCVNPAHLEVVSPQTNTLRGTSPAAGHAVKTHCPAGHAYEGENLWTNGRHRLCRTCYRERRQAARAKTQRLDERKCRA